MESKMESAAPTNPRASAGLLTSATRTTTSGAPTARQRWATACKRSNRRAQMASLAPLRANSSAVASPIPLEAPVTRTAAPRSRMLGQLSPEPPTHRRRLGPTTQPSRAGCPAAHHLAARSTHPFGAGTHLPPHEIFDFAGTPGLRSSLTHSPNARAPVLGADPRAPTPQIPGFRGDPGLAHLAHQLAPRGSVAPGLGPVRCRSLETCDPARSSARPSRPYNPW